MSLPLTPKQWTRQTKTSPTQTFLISTDKSLLSTSAINAAFASDFMYWASPIADDHLRAIIDNSFCFGLYDVSHLSSTNTTTTPTTTTETGDDRTHTTTNIPNGHSHNNDDDTHEKENDNNNDNDKTEPQSLKQIGFARLITDNYTFAYMTDVYVLPEYQGLGLGGWIIDCVDELMKPLPHLRWFMLRTASEKSRESYERRLGMVVLDNGDPRAGGINMGRKGKANLV